MIFFDLKSKKNELQVKYRALENTPDEKWYEAKDAFTSSAESFKEGFSKVQSLLKN